MSLCAGGVGEHHAAVHVTDGINALDVGHHVVVHFDATAAYGNTHSLNSLRQHGLASHGHQNLLGSHALRLAFELIGHGKTVVALGDAVDGSAGDDLDATFAQDGFQPLGYILVKRRQDFLAVLDYSHLDAKRAEHGGKLHAYNAATHDAEALGQRFHRQDVVAGHCQVGALDGQAAWS